MRSVMRSVIKVQWTVCAALMWLAMPTTSQAQSVGFTYWQSNGGGCVPTDKTIREDQYWTVTGGGRVKYRGIGTQPLVFSCPVSSINPNVSAGDGTVLRLFYQDPDGLGNAFSVVARLLSFAKSNGALREFCRVTSDRPGQWQSSLDVCGPIDLNADLYWVEVVIRRTASSSLVVEFNGVSLEGLVF
jgi:hypothetical protein